MCIRDRTTDWAPCVACGLWDTNLPYCALSILPRRDRGSATDPHLEDDPFVVVDPEKRTYPWVRGHRLHAGCAVKDAWLPAGTCKHCKDRATNMTAELPKDNLRPLNGWPLWHRAQRLDCDPEICVYCGAEGAEMVMCRVTARTVTARPTNGPAQGPMHLFLPPGH